ncbi:MAG TPA: UDP-N-acetylmuramoyl-L-alanine--D-glutamate ligase [Firmicutes bacterium]|nr:UDP-N-acetylmuramoyl-L-alanine--D-glutamate ligase [Bacillota bacterium]
MNERDIHGKLVLVLGLGRSGIAACRLCHKQGARVIGMDRRGAGELNGAVEDLRRGGIEIILENDQRTEPIDLLVCSPGIPFAHPTIQWCRQLDIPVVSEIELASWYCPGTLVAVTGTDGKSTVVSLVHQILRDQDRPARLVGNIGNPFSGMLVDNPPDASTICVIEVSSYQLALIRDFHPHVAAILNVAADHLDHHGSFQDYARAKYRITLNQTPDDFLIRPLVLPDTFQSRAETLFWADQPHELPGVQFDPRNGKVTTRLAETMHSYFFQTLSRLMPHQRQNLLAALAICLPFQLDLKKAMQTMLAFPGLPHRLEYLGKWHGINYYNDSKATNVHACKAALEGLEGPLILLAGGLPKQEDYSQLLELLKRKTKRVLVFGPARELLEKAWGKDLGLTSVASLEQATRLAVDWAEPGDTVLLSPACASQDRFQDFEQRGNFFKSLISEWVIEKPS